MFEEQWSEAADAYRKYCDIETDVSYIDLALFFVKISKLLDSNLYTIFFYLIFIKIIIYYKNFTISQQQII